MTESARRLSRLRCVAASSDLSVRISTSLAATLIRFATYSESVKTRRGDVTVPPPPKADGDRADGDSGDRSGDEYRASTWGVVGELDISTLVSAEHCCLTRGGRPNQQTMHAVRSQAVQVVRMNGRPRNVEDSGFFRVVGECGRATGVGYWRRVLYGIVVSDRRSPERWGTRKGLQGHGICMPSCGRAAKTALSRLHVHPKTVVQCIASRLHTLTRRRLGFFGSSMSGGI